MAMKLTRYPTRKNPRAHRPAEALLPLEELLQLVRAARAALQGPPTYGPACRALDFGQVSPTIRRGAARQRQPTGSALLTPGAQEA